MNKYKIIHVHGDIKFFKLSNTFNSLEFENTVVFIGKKIDCDQVIDDNVICFERKKFVISDFVDYCKDTDMIVFYSIDVIATRIILALPSTIKIGWRFFGFELYSRKKEYFITKTTKLLLLEDEMQIEEVNKLNNKKNQNKTSFLLDIKQKFHSIFFPKKDYFLEAVSRCDIFMGLFEEEHEMLKRFFPNLPKFIPVGIDGAPLIEIDKIEKKGNYFFVGNSRNFWNNHFEILEIIKNTKTNNDYQAILFLNYGYEGNYFKKLLEYSKSINKVTIVEDFLNYEEYNKHSLKCAALVLNSKRQLAGNNIRKAFEYGTKVYLNESNLFFDYFKKNGFILFDIKQFETDYATGNLVLDEESFTHNYTQLQKLMEKNSNFLFQKNIIKFFQTEAEI